MSVSLDDWPNKKYLYSSYYC